MPLEDERDYPELNKCPDCETFFANDTCPLCGKLCPEEMRAGNRKKLKQKKNYHHETHSSGRVQFVPWYLSTWFIIVILVWQPIIGLILTWVGYWKKKWKILATVLAVLYFGGSVVLGGVFGLFESILYREELPVDLSLTESEYIEACVEMDAETVFRNSKAREGEFVSLTLTVEGVWEDEWEYEENYPVYLECSVEEDGKTWVFLVRDYRQDADAPNFLAGDTVTVYGQIGGNASIYNQTAGTLNAPLINMLYATIEN